MASLRAPHQRQAAPFVLAVLAGCSACSSPAGDQGPGPPPATPDLSAGVLTGPGYRPARPSPFDPTTPSGNVPTLLSQTGLYSSIATKTVAAGVDLFQPNWALWSDGAEKTRWVRLPEEMTVKSVDNTDMNRWKFPVGIKFWKEFKKDGKRLETRLIWKRTEPTFSDVGWELQTYVWKDDESDAVLQPMGLQNTRGTGHEVPRQIDCGRCHRPEFDAPLGFGAMQLAGSGTGLRLRDLMTRGRLTAAVANPDALVPPGDATNKAALGYLHANCGNCHAPDSQVFVEITMSLRLDVTKLASVTTTPTYLTTANQLTTTLKAGAKGLIRLKPGAPADSEMIRRMGIRMFGPESLMMPPVGSNAVDTDGRTLITSWISSLP